MEHHSKGILHDQARRGMRPRGDYWRLWVQEGNDLEVGGGSEEAGTETETEGGVGGRYKWGQGGTLTQRSKLSPTYHRYEA